MESKYRPNGIGIAVVNVADQNMSGFQVSAFNYAGGTMEGGQFGVIGNVAGRNMVGGQAAIFYNGASKGNMSGNISGFQVGGLNAATYRSMDGFQLGIVNNAFTMKGMEVGFINASQGSMKGVQIAVMLNGSSLNGHSYSTDGFQLALVNSSKGLEVGQQIGVINYWENCDWAFLSSEMCLIR